MMRWIASLAVVAVLSSVTAASAQPTKDPAKRDEALALYERGNVKYNLGAWKEAIELFTQAYETYAAPEFLFNIAQAYRQDENCERALFFYRRYLDNRPDAANRAEVEAFMAELESKTDCKNSEPTEQVATDTTTDDPAEVPMPDPDPQVAQTVEYEEEPIGPQVLSARIAIGPSFASIGPLETPVLLAVAGGVAYPLEVGEFAVEPGIVLSYTPVPWERGDPAVVGTAGLTGILANVSGYMPVGWRLAARADLGAGVQIMSGLQEENNPFLDMSQSADGAITMFHARLGLGLDLAINEQVLVSVEPVFSFSPTSELRDDIDSINRFDIMLGAGYRL